MKFESHILKSGGKGSGDQTWLMLPRVPSSTGEQFQHLQVPWFCLLPAVYVRDGSDGLMFLHHGGGDVEINPVHWCCLLCLLV